MASIIKPVAIAKYYQPIHGTRFDGMSQDNCWSGAVKDCYAGIKAPNVTNRIRDAVAWNFGTSV